MEHLNIEEGQNLFIAAPPRNQVDSALFPLSLVQLYHLCHGSGSPDQLYSLRLNTSQVSQGIQVKLRYLTYNA